jgi:hypothetical protein
MKRVATGPSSARRYNVLLRCNLIHRAALLLLAVALGATVGDASSALRAGSRTTESQALATDGRQASAPARIALFQADGFPTVDGPAIARPVLDEALRGLPVDVLGSAEAIRDGLKAGRVEVLVLPYGSAFPLDAWDAIRQFVASGGSLVVLGGAPFQQPILRRAGDAASGEGWIPGARQPSFAHDLLIGPAEAVTIDETMSRPALLSEWTVPIARPRTSWALTVRFATRPDLAQEEGAAGPRNALLRPLAHVNGADGVPRACPLLEIDRLRGPDMGGRWVFATSDAPLDAAAIRAAVERAREGAVEVVARPVRAAIDPGETASIRISVHRPAPRRGERPATSAHLVVRDDRGRPMGEQDVTLTGPAESVTGLAALGPVRPLAPGLYHVEVTIPGVTWHPRSVTTGFWVRDRALLASAPRLSVSRDWIRRDGQVFPIVGTTYMASDVHRKFLFEPNPHVWDRDFADMQRQGVNLVRTGLWTGWSRVMLDPGAVDESVLDALDAYVLTAAKHGIPVCFTFFAFLPPAFGGTNPYLDPRSLEGQRELLLHIASRYRGVGWIHYDLINEPSYAPLDKPWQTRPFGDPYERRAWQEWVRARHGDDPARLRDRWREEGDVLAVPSDRDFTYAMVRGDRAPRKAADFVLFTQDVVAGWAARLRDILRSAAGDTLVTLGQDEGGTATRPTPQLHGGSVDYTAVHTWWNNDDLLWDGVVTKVPEKPNVVQETGLMRLEDTDGTPWRSTEAAAALLERKFAYAIASRGAGTIEWAWNINPYQPIDNEAVIGLFRPDGTAKPEMQVLADFAAFFKTAVPWLDDYEPDPVVVVLPHSRLFAGRPGAMDAVKATVRVLAERFGVVPTALSEFRLTPERLRGAKLIVVPVPETLEDSAARALLEASRAGAKVLISGAVEGTPYGEITDALQSLGVTGPSVPVALRELVSEGRSFLGTQPPAPPGGTPPTWVTFDAGKSQYLKRANFIALREAAANVWHEPLPLEFAREEEPLVALLGRLLQSAGMPKTASREPVATRVLTAPRALLVVMVNETSADIEKAVLVEGRRVTIAVQAGRSRLVLVERTTGRVLAATPGPQVTTTL